MTISPPIDPTEAPTTVKTTGSEWGEDSSCQSCDEGDKQSCGPLLGGKCVSFNSWIDVVQVEHFSDMSPDETRGTWYSQQEFAEIKRNLKQSVNLMVKYGIIDDDVEFCSRGLETREDTRSRRENQKEAIAAVINEQYLQRFEKAERPEVELISMLYSVFSWPCQQQAHTVALRDAMDVGQSRQVEESETSLDSEMPYPGEGVLQRLAGEGRLNGTDDQYLSIEEWLVERFEKAERLVSVSRGRPFSGPAVDIE